jgi:hypothetical protein
MRGWSQSGAEGMPLHDAAAIAAFADELERHLPVRRLDAVINSEAVADELDGLMREGWTPRSLSTV